MLLGKRPRPPIKRTTSMTGITVDVTTMDSSESSDLPPPNNLNPHQGLVVVPQNINGYDQRFLSMVSPRNQLRSSNNNNINNNNNGFMETSHFLTTCGFCKRRLPPGRDIYMYRGDTAFCSLECREQQMKQDERKEKLSGESHASSSTSRATGAAPSSKASTKSEPLAAA